MKCARCAHENALGNVFCGGCGARLARPCPGCGRSNPPQDAFCGSCGATLSEAAAAPHVAAAAPEPAAGERRQLTVLFCDVVGSTELAARLDPEDWQEVLQSYQSGAGEVVARHGGHVAQYLGDGLLVYFGWPKTYDDAAERAVRAALALVETAAGVRADGAPLAVRVGLHTGPVVMGALGGEGRSETLALGDTPNVAARVQGAAEPGTVLISAATRRLVAGLFVMEERGARALKGVAEPVVLTRVVQPSGARSRLAVAAERHTTFVGRQTELGVLADAWEHVVEGRGQTVLVSGEAGLGKSRLCYELRQRLAREPHTWLECRCSPYTEATAFRPVVELVEQALAFQPADAPAERLRKLASGLARGGFAADETVPLLAEWLELPEAAGFTPLAINPDLKRHKTLETLAAWNLRRAELQPLVVLVEDLHWCDPSSLELLGRLVAQSATARVLLVGTARPEFASPWPARENLRRLTLGRLTKRQARELIAAVSGPPGLPEAAVEQLVARADGVPLYAEELTRSVAEAEGGASAATIPATLQDSLFARLDRLSSAKEVAQRASVLGREFPYPLLASMAGIEEAALREGLARLVGAELLFVRGEPPEATYTFKHALVQEAAYASLLKRTRHELHGRVADVLAADTAAEPELLARHAEAAGRTLEAISGFQRAGRRARSRSAYEEAIQHFRRAIALLAAEPEGAERDALEAALQFVLGETIGPAWGFARPGADVAFDRAQALFEVVGDVRGQGFALAGLAAFSHNTGQVERACALAARVLAMAEETSDPDLALRGHLDPAVAELYQGKLESSLAHCETALALCEPGRSYLRDSGLGSEDSVVFFESDDPGVFSFCCSAWTLWMLGRPDRALARAREGTALARRIGHLFTLALALVFEAVVHALRGHVAEQQERAAEAIALSEEYGFPLFLGLARTLHAASRVAAGEHEAAAEMGAGAAQSGGTGNLGGAPGLLAILGDAYRTAGQLAEARGAVEGGLALAAQTGQHFMDAELHRLRGEIALAAGGSSADAEGDFRRALEIARAQEARSLELRAATSLARLWRDQGRGAEARALLHPVCAWFTEGFDTLDLVKAKALLIELEPPAGP